VAEHETTKASDPAEALGPEPGVVRLAEPDPRWPVLFAAERERILRCCGAVPICFEHVGSTSIPGLCAKPILDIAAGRAPGSALPDCIAALVRAGYEHRGERGVPGREFFCRGEPRAYHLHLVVEGGPLWRDYLVFRDYLRAHPEAVRAFAETKRALAARLTRDREAYTLAKTPHVEAILLLARAAREPVR
jgi:GrpB-like predicted nucleotidyltransferase (UPF0157 family)